MTLDILIEEPHFLAVNKPAPLLTQAPPDVPSLESLVKSYIRDKYSKPAGVYLGIPHRLDRPVSGVVLFARNTKAAQRFAAQFQQHRVEKTYWALVQGTVSDESGEWTDWLRKVPDESRAEICAEGDSGAKKAVTRFRRIQSGPEQTMLELRPLTGRMHQLRLQAAVRGWPILGDELYGATTAFGPNAELPRDRLIALHARRLRFEHPKTFEPIEVTAELPLDWTGLFDQPAV